MQLDKNYYSWNCANLPVYKGMWDPSGQAAALQEEAISAPSSLCDAAIPGQRVPTARWPPAPHAAPSPPQGLLHPTFFGRGWREKRAHHCETAALERACCFLELEQQETSCLKMTGLICGVIKQSRNPSWAGSPVCSVLAARAAADLSLILPDKGLCWCISLAQTLFFFAWMLSFSILDEKAVSPPLSHP